MEAKNPLIDEFLNQTKTWKEELHLLRSICLSCGLQEELKWKHPCYTYQGKNVVILMNFKSYFAVGFFKGALLKDSHQKLITAGENSQSTKQFRFSNLAELEAAEDLLKNYLFEAMEIEKLGLKVTYKPPSAYEAPEELTVAFAQDATFKNAFDQLTPGRQKGYLLFFSGAKQSETRKSRIEKSKARILKGKGIDDCICGLSKRMPRCDGSHKYQ